MQNKFVRFVKYVRPDESYKYYNKENYRIVYVNPDNVSYVDKTIVSHYDEHNRTKEVLVMRLNFTNMQDVLVEGTEEEVIQKLSSVVNENHQNSKVCPLDT